MLSKRKRKARNNRGSQIVEALCGCLFLIPVALFLFDICFIFLATNLNDNVARDAARAASTVIPVNTAPGRFQLAGAPFDRADSIVRLARSRASGYITNIQIDRPNSTTFLAAPIPTAFQGGAYNGATTVRTNITFRLPVTVLAPILMPAQLTFPAQATFPITAQLQGTARNFVP